MEHILKNWSEYIIGLTTLIISIIVSIAIYRRQRKIKELAYEILLNDTLLKIKEDLNGKLTVLFDGKSADNIRFLVLHFTVNGNDPILKSDFENDIQIEFDDACKPLSVDVLEKKPSNIDLKFKIKGNGINISPCLLNPKDSFTIRVILDSKAIKLKVLSRIAGLNKIVEVDSTNRLEPELKKNLFFLILISVWLWVFGAISLRQILPIEGRNNFTGIILQVCGGFVLAGLAYLIFEKGRLSSKNNR